LAAILGCHGITPYWAGYCHVDRKFKDFILSRFLKTRHEGKAGAAPADDIRWTEFFEVVLSPNPSLSEEQQRVIALDYNMTGGQVAVPVRRALLYYFRKRLRLDVAEALDSPHESPVVVSNREAFANALAEATA
jgi:hypothetical protein